jgi:hypothetical protein
MNAIRRMSLAAVPFTTVLALTAVRGSGADAPPAPTDVTRPASHDAYVRETKDREWHLYFSGEVPIYSWAGASLIVHDATGRIIHREVIPRGVYPKDKPRVITIKPDGLTGDYRIVMVGHQIQFLGSCGTVSTDLAFEAFQPSTNLVSANFWKVGAPTKSGGEEGSAKSGD